MKKEIRKNSEEEVKFVKSKYRKMLLVIIIIPLLILLLYGGNLVITALRLQKVLQNNIDIDFGTNYKLTRNAYGSESTTYYKDGVINHVLVNGKSRIYGKDNQVYFVFDDKKEYQKVEMNGFFDTPACLNLLNYFWIEKDDVSSLKEMILLTYQSGVKFGSESIANQKYITVELKAFSEKLWINADTNLIDKENMDGQILEQKVEKNVVTNKDIKAPWELGYTETLLFEEQQ